MFYEVQCVGKIKERNTGEISNNENWARSYKEM